jgi:mannose-6-phosphate isomerase-like protein (cupin superfamily)
VVRNSIRAYFVIEGSGVFEVGHEMHEVGPTDFVVIPSQTPYAYRWKMKLFEVNTPATDS